MEISITVLYAGILGLLHFVLTMRVIRGRQTKNINLGDGADGDMQRRIRGHANFVEYVPFILILMLALESSGTSPHIIHGLGLVTVIARTMHGIALSFTDNWVAGRFYGTLLTLLTLAIASVAAIVRGLGI